jgi:hypothetical protein
MLNPVLDFIDQFHHAHPILFWLTAILGFPEAELVALIAIAIGCLAI